MINLFCEKYIVLLLAKHKMKNLNKQKQNDEYI